MKKNIATRLFVLCKLTNDCNQSCKHCVTDAKSGIIKELSYDVVRNLMKDMKKIDRDCIISFIGGEATVWPYFYEMIRCEEFKKIRYKKLNTNATALTDKSIISLKEADFFEIRVSIDSATEQYHDDLRGKGTFEKSISAIKKMSNLKLPVTSGTVVSTKNIECLGDIVSMLENLNIKVAHFFPYVVKGRGKVFSELALSQEDILCAQKMLCEISGEAFHKEDALCDYGTAYFKIEDDGKCDLHFAESELHHVCLGNINKESFINLYTKAIGFLEDKVVIDCNRCKYNKDPIMCENMHNYCMMDLDMR